MIVSHSQLDEQSISELASFFDLLAKYDFEDAQKHQVFSQEVGKGSSLTEGESFLESCDPRQTNRLENPSFKDTEEKQSL